MRCSGIDLGIVIGPCTDGVVMSTGTRAPDMSMDSGLGMGTGMLELPLWHKLTGPQFRLGSSHWL